MQAVCRVQFLPQAPRKVELVAGWIRGKDADSAFKTLNFAGRRAALPVIKALKSAVANLTVKAGGKTPDLKEVRVSQCIVNQGPVLKRIHPGSMGRAMPFKKKMCHLFIEVQSGKAE